MSEGRYPCAFRSQDCLLLVKCIDKASTTTFDGKVRIKDRLVLAELGLNYFIDTSLHMLSIWLDVMLERFHEQLRRYDLSLALG